MDTLELHEDEHEVKFLDLGLPCPFLDLPRELFEFIIAYLDSMWIYNLALSNKGLFGNNAVWKNIIEEPTQLVPRA
jgi:hypothetical protein